MSHEELAFEFDKEDILAVGFAHIYCCKFT
jgi:hypothetical protein